MDSIPLSTPFSVPLSRPGARRRFQPLARTVALALLLVSGFFVAPSWAEDEVDPNGARTLMHQQRTRTYHVRVPPGWTRTRPAPLVLALHGGGGTALGLERSVGSRLVEEAAKRGWVVVFPEGVAKGWNDGRPLRGRRDRQRRGVDDLGFLTRVVDALHRTHGIDVRRVYATGISNGGFMSLHLGLHRSTRFAAVAAVTAQVSEVNASVTPRVPVPMMMVNGTEDPLVPYGGGEIRVLGQSRGRILATEASAKRWAGFFGLTHAPKVVALPNRRPFDGTKTTRHTWARADGIPRVMLLKVEGGGHTWPGGNAYLPRGVIGRVARDFHATPEIFAFFAQHTRAADRTQAATTPHQAPADE